MVIINALMPFDESGFLGSVRISNGLITQIAASIMPEEGEEVIDAAGRWLLPGLVDLDCQAARYLIKENLSTLLSQLAAGGATTVLLQPDKELKLTDPEMLSMVTSTMASEDGVCVVQACQACDGERLNDLAILLDAGAAAITTSSDIDSNLLLRSAQYAAMTEKPLIVACNDSSLQGAGVMHEGAIAASMGLPGWPVVAETAETARVIEIARYTKATLWLRHLSCAISLQLTKRAKAEGVQLAAGVHVHHLLLDESACEGFNTFAKTIPPLRSTKDREALLQGVGEGSIDYVSSGNVPVVEATKDVAFEVASSGIESSSIFLPLLYTAVVVRGGMTMKDLVRVGAETPARLLGLWDRGVLKEGLRADLILFDPSLPSDPALLPKGSPYATYSLMGRVDAVWGGGRLLWGGK
ncbi:MAG: dihydroorotase [Campylobacterales bacterium]